MLAYSITSSARASTSRAHRGRTPCLVRYRRKRRSNSGCWRTAGKAAVTPFVSNWLHFTSSHRARALLVLALPKAVLDRNRYTLSLVERVAGWRRSDDRTCLQPKFPLQTVNFSGNSPNLAPGDAAGRQEAPGPQGKRAQEVAGPVSSLAVYWLVRFALESGHPTCRYGRPLRANRGLVQCSTFAAIRLFPLRAPRGGEGGGRASNHRPQHPGGRAVCLQGGRPSPRPPSTPRTG